jgi:hypothetical protein
MPKIKGHLYWAFLDENEQITICRYKNDRQIELTEEMPFVKGIFNPFYALNRQDAEQKILEFIRKDYEDYKKEAK